MSEEPTEWSKKYDKKQADGAMEHKKFEDLIKSLPLPNSDGVLEGNSNSHDAINYEFAHKGLMALLRQKRGFDHTGDKHLADASTLLLLRDAMKSNLTPKVHDKLREISNSFTVVLGFDVVIGEISDRDRSPY